MWQYASVLVRIQSVYMAALCVTCSHLFSMAESNTRCFSNIGIRDAAWVCRYAVRAEPMCRAKSGRRAEARSGCLQAISATSCCVTLRSRRKKKSSKTFLPMATAANLCSAADHAIQWPDRILLSKTSSRLHCKTAYFLLERAWAFSKCKSNVWI